MGNREFTLTDLLSIALKRIWIILAAMIVCGAAALYYSLFMVTLQYQSNAKYLIDTTSMLTNEEVSSTNGQVEEQRNAVLSRLIVPTYIEILNTRNFANHIAHALTTPEFEEYAHNRLASEEFDGVLTDERRKIVLSKTYSGETLYQTISYSFQEELESYSVSVVALDPVDALLIAECIAEESGDYLLSKRSSAKNTLKLIDSPRYKPQPINIRTVMMLILGAFVGAAIAYAISFIIEINDVRVKDEKEVADILELPIIGSIPEYAPTDSAHSDKK